MGEDSDWVWSNGEPMAVKTNFIKKEKFFLKDLFNKVFKLERR